MQTEVLYRILFPLFDEYENRSRNVVIITHNSIEEYEPLQKTLSTLVSEGSLLPCEKSKIHYRLTDAGYAKYKSQIEALRILPR